MRVMIPVTIIIVAFAGLFGMAVATMGTPEVQVHQMLTDEFIGEEVKVQGRIGAIESDVRPLRFTVVDKENPVQSITVEIDDVRPDIFDVGNDVAVIGTMREPGGRLAGNKIFTKCPSKYEAAEGERPGYGEGEGGYPSKPRAEPVPAKPAAPDA